MILFCDTSALLKLFVDEIGSDSMAKARSDSEAIAVCRITWAESMAAFAQRSRVKGANQAGLGQAKSLFENTWSNFVISEVTQPLVGTYQRCCPRVVPGLSTLTQCTALCCSWATRKSMAQHLGLRLVVVAPVPNRGCPMSP